MEAFPVVSRVASAWGLELRLGFEVFPTVLRVEQCCLLCPNGDSALGDNGPVAEEAFWRLVDEGLVALVASDDHGRHRPPRLDQAHRLLVERYGEASIEVLFDGTAMPWIC